MQVTHVFKDGTQTNNVEGKIIPYELSKKIITILTKSKERKVENETSANRQTLEIKQHHKTL